MIEKNIPIPKPLSRSKYPLTFMEVGDSIRVECSEYKKLSAALYNCKKITGKNFMIRTHYTEHGKKDHIRAWRTA